MVPIACTSSLIPPAISYHPEKVSKMSSSTSNSSSHSIPFPMSSLQPSKYPIPLYLPPQERNLGTAPKRREKSSNHSQALIQNPKIAQDIFACTMNAPIVMLNSEELLSLSSDVRTKYSQRITSKQVTQEGRSSTNIFATDSTTTPDSYEMHIHLLNPSISHPKKHPKFFREDYRNSSLFIAPAH